VYTCAYVLLKEFGADPSASPLTTQPFD